MGATMHHIRATLFGLALAAACLSSALAQTKINLSTSERGARKWTVREDVSGAEVLARAVYNNGYSYGNVASITIPFTNCDGFWVARRSFEVPVGAKNAVLKITALGVDDRAVVRLNGVDITSVGTVAKGKGNMQFRDPGPNKHYDFQFTSGAVQVTDTTHLLIGHNILRVFVNNTNDGIYGDITPVSQTSPSEFGITATVSYTP
jgi:hypothetical protein